MTKSVGSWAKVGKMTSNFLSSNSELKFSKFEILAKMTKSVGFWAKV